MAKIMIVTDQSEVMTIIHIQSSKIDLAQKLEIEQWLERAINRDNEPWISDENLDKK